MINALKVYSTEEGYFSEEINATEIKSHAHARKLAPFVDKEHQLLFWVNWGKLKRNNKPRVAHFRHYPKNRKTIKGVVSEEIRERKKKSEESKKHIKAKEEILSLLRKLLSEKKHLPWAFKDPEISEFPLSGDFLAGAESIEKEHKVATPFGETYRLDVAILGKVIHTNPIVLVGIEIEFTHKFDFAKAMMCKALGFPLLSVDVTDIDIEKINIDWAKNILMETTKNSTDGYRRNYIYIHRMLSTIYIDIPRKLSPESRHQYVIFTQEHEKLLKRLKQLKSLCLLSEQQISISPVSAKNDQLRTQVKNAGNLAGENWEVHNPFSYIQLTIEKPISKSGNIYYFHLVLTYLCNSVFDCLVGYKFETGEKHEIGDSLQWNMGRKIDGKFRHFHVAPKRVSEPVKQILEKVGKTQSANK